MSATHYATVDGNETIRGSKSEVWDAIKNATGEVRVYEIRAESSERMGRDMSYQVWGRHTCKRAFSPKSATYCWFCHCA